MAGGRLFLGAVDAPATEAWQMTLDTRDTQEPAPALRASHSDIELGPGSIDLAEDLTGKGHITRVIGNEDRVTIAIPVSDTK